MTGRIHSIESLGALDGPGVRLVVFLQGCPLRCRYCHNPDTWDPSLGQPMESDEIVARAASMRPYFGESGGVTLSGGEPLAQTDFAREIFYGCRRERVHTALDTTGFRFDESVKACLEQTDLVLLDIKHPDPDRQRILTGHSLDRAPAFLDYVGAHAIPLWIRHVIVPGWTDTEANMDALAALLQDAPSLKRIELLPYHNMAEMKWQALGRSYPLAGVAPPSTERMAVLRARLASNLEIAGRGNIVAQSPWPKETRNQSGA